MGSSGGNAADAAEDGIHRYWCNWWCPHAILDDDGKLCWSGERYATGFLHQTITVFQRQAMLISRSPTVRARIGRAIFQGFLLGTMFYQLGKSQQSADNRFGALFISLSAIVMGSVSTIPELYSQRRVFYQERRAGYFRSIVWQLSLVLTELPICAIEMACYSTLLYGLCGLRGGLLSLPFLYFYLSMCAMNVICWSVAATSVMLTDSVVAAQALVPVYNAANILFSGYLMSKKDIPSYLQWLMVTSTVTRPFVGIAINEMETQIFDCKDEERVPFLNDPLLNVTAPIGFNNGHYRACPIQTGEDALKYLYGLGAFNCVVKKNFFNFLYNTCQLTFFFLLLFFPFFRCRRIQRVASSTLQRWILFVVPNSSINYHCVHRPLDNSKRRSGIQNGSEWRTRTTRSTCSAAG